LEKEQISEDNSRNLDIAIIGMSCRFPGAKNTDEFWQNLCNGIESIARLSDNEILESGVDPTVLSNPRYVKAAPVLENPGMFDAGFFGFAPAEALTLDPQHRILLECAHEAMENAGYDPGRFAGRVGVFTGCAMNTYLMNSGLYSRFADEYIPILINNDKDFLSTRISYKLDLRGPSISVQTACSTSLVAIHLACQSLLSGESDMAIAGAVSVRVPHKAGYLHDGGGVLSPDGHVRAFDARANGTVFGSGAGIVVLKRLPDAILDGDTIYAVVKGSAVNNDGSEKAGYSAPSVNRQAEAVIESLSASGVAPDTIGYIEAHGSGTPVGDSIELAALTKAFRYYTQRKAFCAIGSVKTNVGHLDVAAGIAGVIKTVLALRHHKIPPSLNFTEPNPEIDFGKSPFYVSSRLMEWKQDGSRRAGVMSTGMGGTNAYLVLEEAPEIEAPASSPLPKLLVLSARTKTALNQVADRLAQSLKTDEHADMDNVAYTLQVGRKALANRQFIVSRNREEAIGKLENQSSRDVFSFKQDDPPGRSFTFLFPGVGDHYVGMGHDLYQGFSAFRREVDRCAEILKTHIQVDIRSILYPPGFQSRLQGAKAGIDLKKMLGAGKDQPADDATQRLNRTIYAQPALFTIEYALAQLWMSWGVIPNAIVGHSMGEYVAACLAGVFSLEDALRLICRRASLVDQLPPGKMLAVALPEEDLLPLLKDGVSISLINGPKLCVVAGPPPAMEKLERTLDEKKILARPVHNQHAFHSRLLDPIVEEYEKEVKKVTLRAPQIPYISNITGSWIKSSDAVDPAYWAIHSNHTVRFMDALSTMWQKAEGVLLEIGPGKTLGVLAMQHPAREKSKDAFVVSSLRHGYDNQSDIDFIINSLGRLWMWGAEINWEKYHDGEKRRRVPLPGYPFERVNYWIQGAFVPPRATDSLASIRKKESISEWFYVPSWKRMLPKAVGPNKLSKEDLKKQVWLVFIDQSGVASDVANRLRDAGQDVICVLPGKGFSALESGGFTINPGDCEDYALLMSTLQRDNKVPDCIVHAWSVTSESSRSTQRASLELILQSGFYSLVYLAKELGKHNIRKAVRVFVFSNNLYEIVGTESTDPEKSLMLGPCLVIPQEYPNVTIKNIDLDAERAVQLNGKDVEQALGELFNEDSDLVVAYRGKNRWVQSYEQVVIKEPNQGARVFRQGGVYLITGGLGEIGFEIGKYLARTAQAKLVLIGRSKLPDRNQWNNVPATSQRDPQITEKIQKIQKLEALGAEVLYFGGNVADLDAMKNAIEATYQSFGTLHGVIHCAGIVRERLSDIQDLDLSKCDLHFLSKVQGLYVLEEVLEGKSIDFCMLFSSLSAVLGGLGEVAYSSSNIFMDAYAQKHNRYSKVPWISVNWDLWRIEDGKDNFIPGTGRTLAQLGLVPEEGMAAIERVLAIKDVSRIVVSTGGLNDRISQWIKLESLRKGSDIQQTSAASAQFGRPDLQVAYLAPRDETERLTAETWTDVLGICPVGVSDSFPELGGNSLQAIQIMSRLRDVFQVDLSIRTLFDAPTVAELAAIIKRKILSEIAQLSDEEARAMTIETPENEPE